MAYEDESPRGGGNSLLPFSQQRPMTTNLSCCLGLIDNGQHDNKDTSMLGSGLDKCIEQAPQHGQELVVMRLSVFCCQTRPHAGHLPPAWLNREASRCYSWQGKSEAIHFCRPGFNWMPEAGWVKLCADSRPSTVLLICRSACNSRWLSSPQAGSHRA